jgi:hypothetical protein
MGDRVDFAYRLLLKGHSCSRVVAELADSAGISRRQGRRIVNRAYAELKRDLDDAEVDRVMVVSQTIHMLQEGAAKAFAHNHVSAMVGCIRELRELIQIANERSNGYTHGRSRYHA